MNKESSEKQQQQQTESKEEEENQPLIFQKSPVLAIFEDELQAEIFNARCHDTGEPLTCKIFFCKLIRNLNFSREGQSFQRGVFKSKYRQKVKST